MKIVGGILIGAWAMHLYYRWELSREAQKAGERAYNRIAVALQDEGWSTKSIKEFLANT